MRTRDRLCKPGGGGIFQTRVYGFDSNRRAAGSYRNVGL